MAPPSTKAAVSHATSISPSSRRRGFLRFLTGRYLTATMCKNLLAYKYDGEDRSYLYRYVLQPMNAQLIRFVPVWAAPNLITLVGLSIVCVAHLLTQYFAPNFDQPMPPVMYLVCALSLFAYQTIDNLDGRQARRTGSSSPLGLLFDHGVDALNVTMAGLLLAAVYSVGRLGPIALFAFWNIGFIPFVVATWEEYNTGKLTLAEVNGPSDGMAMCMVWSSLGFFMPGFYLKTFGEVAPSLFKGTFAADLPTSSLPFIVGYLGLIATLGGNFYQVSKKVTDWPKSLSKLVPFLVMGVCMWTWVLSSPEFFGAHPRVFLFSCCFLFCQMICSLMIAHVCHADYKVRRAVLVPLLVGWTNCVAGPYLLPSVFPIVSPEMTLYALLAFHFSAWLHFIVNAILEITELLNIKCFSIDMEKARRTLAAAHDGSTPAAVAAAEAAEHARHHGIKPLSPTTSSKLLDTYGCSPSPAPARRAD